MTTSVVQERGVMDNAKPIDGFPEYVIDKDGSIYNADTGLKRKPSFTQQGAVKITLFRNGQPHTKSLSLLVAKAWVYNNHDPEIFDTPIHLDNDTTNLHANNLAWRPRWFAVKYQKQYWNEEFRYSRTRVEDVQTGVIYDGLIEPCQRFGLLYIDVLSSCSRGDNVFPTWKTFRFVN